jgi:hypothetical protein
MVIATSKLRCEEPFTCVALAKPPRVRCDDMTRTFAAIALFLFTLVLGKVKHHNYNIGAAELILREVICKIFVARERANIPFTSALC